jgi:hypothetical protein
MNIFKFLSEHNMKIDILQVAFMRGERVDLVQLRINRTWLHHVNHGELGIWPYCVYGRTYKEALENLCKKIQGKTLMFEGEKKDLMVEVPFPLTYSV